MYQQNIINISEHETRLNTSICFYVGRPCETFTRSNSNGTSIHGVYEDSYIIQCHIGYAYSCPTWDTCSTMYMSTCQTEGQFDKKYQCSRKFIVLI